MEGKSINSAATKKQLAKVQSGGWEVKGVHGYELYLEKPIGRAPALFEVPNPGNQSEEEGESEATKSDSTGSEGQTPSDESEDKKHKKHKKSEA